MFLHWLLSIAVVYKIGPRKNWITSGDDPIPDTDSGLPFFKGKKVKGEYSSSWNSPQNYGTSLVNGIPQCYLPPDRGDRPAFTPTGQVGTRFINPVRMKGWVGLVGWLHTEMVYPSTDDHHPHPGTNWLWSSATTLIEASALPLSQTANLLCFQFPCHCAEWGF